MSCEVEDQYEVLDCLQLEQYKAPVVQFSKDRILPIPSKSSELDREVEEELALEMSCEVEDQYEVLDCLQLEQYKAPVVQFSKDRILPIPSKVLMNSGKTSESESDQDTYFDSTIKYQQRNEDVIAKKTMSKMEHCIAGYLSATPISPPPKSAKDFTSGPPISPRQKSAMAFTPTAPPPPPPKSAMAFTSAAPPPPPPKSAVAFTSATPPPPPPKSAMAFTPATPIPPPPKSAKTFTSGPPIPPHRKSAMAFTPATPIPPPPKSALAFTPAAPPPPPPKTAMAFTPGTPPPPPPKSAVAFTSATSPPPPPPPPPPPKSAMAFTPATPIPPPPKSAVAFTSATPPPPPPPHRKSAMAFTPATQCTQRARKSRLAFTPAAPPPPSPQHGRSSRQTSICNRFSGADECLLDRVSSPVTEGLSHCFGQSQQSARPLSSANRGGKSTEDLISLSVLDENKKFRKKKMSAVFKDESVDLPRRLRTAVARERPDLTDVRTFCMEDAGSKQTYGYGSAERSRGLHVDDDRFQKLRRRAGIETDILQDISDVGTIMPTVAKAALKNLSKKDLDTLKALQNRLGGWTRSQVEKELFIDLTACMETLNTAGLKSLGNKVAMEIENVLVAAFVVMWMLKTLVPELFPLNTETRGWSDSVVNIAKGVLEIYDHDQSLLDKAISYCDQIERAHPRVASILELGPNWFAVALKMLGC
ncbi:uncharacterized protein LOC132545763 [Ylistrum balloti]|uniref:uncharacterized protein LOC132545763 n=1 Tax=Ylistrum balloti TaxID=509963 RepID=UPI002905AB62|nr:uncharacterized protein LOC132545763 [Ylistrum balloti]